MKYILTCTCFNMGKKASVAFSTMFPKEVLPDIIKGRDRIYKFGKSINNEHIIAISKLTGRFAYFVEIDENNKIVKEYDLVNVRRIA